MVFTDRDAMASSMQAVALIFLSFLCLSPASKEIFTGQE